MMKRLVHPSAVDASDSEIAHVRTRAQQHANKRAKISSVIGVGKDVGRYLGCWDNFTHTGGVSIQKRADAMREGF